MTLSIITGPSKNISERSHTEPNNNFSKIPMEVVLTNIYPYLGLIGIEFLFEYLNKRKLNTNDLHGILNNFTPPVFDRLYTSTAEEELPAGLIALEKYKHVSKQTMQKAFNASLSTNSYNSLHHLNQAKCISWIWKEMSIKQALIDKNIALNFKALLTDEKLKEAFHDANIVTLIHQTAFRSHHKSLNSVSRIIKHLGLSIPREYIDMTLTTPTVETNPTAEKLFKEMSVKRELLDNNVALNFRERLTNEEIREAFHSDNIVGLMHQTAFRGHEKSFKSVLEIIQHLNINISFRALGIIITIATDQRNVTILKLLFNSSIYDGIRTELLGDALKRSAKGGNDILINGLIESIRFENIDTADLKEAWNLAILNGHVRIVRALIDSNRFNEISRADRERGLSLARLKGHVAIVRTLMNSRCQTPTKQDEHFLLYEKIFGARIRKIKNDRFSLYEKIFGAQISESKSNRDGSSSSSYAGSKGPSSEIEEDEKHQPKKPRR